jgi:protein phosphatase 1 regulatory subunit 37
MDIKLVQVQAPAGQLLSELDIPVAARAIELSTSLAKLIERSNDPDKLEELLTLHDMLSDKIAGRYTVKPKPFRAGLGLNLNDLTPRGSIASAGGVFGAGAGGMESPGLLTPRGSLKGKERAEPEPVTFEQVTTPTFVLASDDDDDERVHGLAFGDAVEDLPPEGDPDSPNQTERSRSWVAEEGEVFRKGTRLLGPEEMEGDYDSEELRVEVIHSSSLCSIWLLIVTRSCWRQTSSVHHHALSSMRTEWRSPLPGRL